MITFKNSFLEIFAPKSRKSILVYQPRMFGDIIIGASAAMGIKEKYPNCHLTYITSCKSLTETNPYIDTSIEILLPKKLERIFFQIVKHLFTHSFFLLHWLPEENIIQSHLSAAGLSRKNYPIRIYLEEKDKILAKEYLEALDLKFDKTIAIQDDFGRKWNEKKFEKLKLALGDKYNLVYIGRHMFHANRKLNFREASAVISNCDLYVGGISGTMHAAVAVGVPTIATPNVFPAGWDMPEYSQNEFIIDEMKKHKTVLPKIENFCGHFATVHNNGKYIYVDGDNYSPQVCFSEINQGKVGRIYEKNLHSISVPCRCSINEQDIIELVDNFFEKLATQ